MSLETKVGAFVLAGLMLLATAIFLLGDFTLESRYTISVSFHDVANLAKDAPVKLAGVEVGRVKGLVLENGRAKVVCSIRKGVDIYKGAKISVASTGIIGSKFLAIEQGKLSQGLIETGAMIEGVDPVSLENSMTKALGSLEDMLGQFNSKGPNGTLAENLRDTVSNVRDLTANLNDLIATSKPNLEKALERTDALTAKLDELLAKTNTVMASLSTDKGAIGAMLNDPKVKEDVKQTIASARDAAASAKDVFGRITQFRVWWNLDWRYENALQASRVDAGVKISPRAGRYYYLGGANLGNTSDQTRSHETDYVQKNRVDALLGFEKGPFDLAVGCLRSAGGLRLTVTPFYRYDFGKRFSVMGQAYDFGRDRIVNGRVLNHPIYDAGAMARVTRWLGIGARVEDIQVLKEFTMWANILFEDQDLAYLFGLVTFGAAGTKGRSVSNAP